MSDLDGIVDSGNSGGGLDPLYADLLAAAAQVGEAERAEQQDYVDSGEYLVKLTKAEGRVNEWEGKTFATGSVGVKILDGKSNVGRVAFGDITVAPATEAWDDQTKSFRKMNPAQYAKAKEEYLATMQRVKRVLGLAQPVPQAATEAAITAWLKPAVDHGAEFVIGIRTKKPDKNGKIRNTIWWANIAAPSDPVYKDKEKKVLKGTALEVLQASIKRAAGKAPAKSGNGSLD